MGVMREQLRGRTVTKYGTTEKRVGPKRREDSSVVDDRTSAIVIDGWHHRAVRTSRSVEPHVSMGTPRDSAYASTEKSCPSPSCMPRALQSSGRSRALSAWKHRSRRDTAGVHSHHRHSLKGTSYYSGDACGLIDR